MVEVIDRERLSWVLLDALALGDTAAARKWNIDRRTVHRYRLRMLSDPELSQLVSEKVAATESELGAIRLRFLRKAIAKLEAKIDAPEATIFEIAGAVKIVGELHQVAEATGDVRPDEPDPDAAAAPAEPADAAHGPH